MLQRSSLGLGWLALLGLLGKEDRLLARDGEPVRPLEAHGPARRVILIHHGGGLSHVDSFDPKPALARLAGEKVPESVARNVPRTNRLRLSNVMPSPFPFARHGECGLEVSSLFSHVAAHADDLCVVRSVRHESVVHTPADYMMLTGSLLGTRPSLGAWVWYGLGSESSDLPGFVNLVAGDHYSGPAAWGAGFLPARFQATTVNAAAGIPHARLPADTSPGERRAQLDLVQILNRRHLERHGPLDDLEARIASYELAFRMQAAAPEAFAIDGESAATRSLYGLEEAETAGFGAHCLLARRLVERGVRFVQLVQGGWDAHSDLRGNHERQARIADRPIAGLLADLKARGLLASTLVVATTEFGRTPTVEGDPKKPGRDHSPAAFSVWLCGAGIRGGHVIGATDDIGYTVVDRPIHPNDLQATMLAAMGIDQRELYFLHHNRRELLTVNGGEVVTEALA